MTTCNRNLRIYHQIYKEVNALFKRRSKYKIFTSLVTLGLALSRQFGGAIIGYGSVSAFIIIPLLFIELKPMPSRRILNWSGGSMKSLNRSIRLFKIDFATCITSHPNFTRGYSVHYAWWTCSWHVYTNHAWKHDNLCPVANSMMCTLPSRFKILY